jgi:ABC-type transport system involved in cytochrome bd biosynthesis, ATPase and permease components
MILRRVIASLDPDQGHGMAGRRRYVRGQRVACIQFLFRCRALPDLSSPETSPESPALRRQRQQWLASLAAHARPQQRLAAAAVCLSGALLVVQAGAIAWLIQHVLVEAHPLAGAATALAVLGGTLLVRSVLGGVAQRAAGDVADAARLALRGQVYRRLLGHGPLWLRQRRTGELGELLLAHGDAIEGYYAGFQPVRAEVMVVPLLIAAAVASVDWVVALILLLTAPLVPFFMMLVGWGAEAAGRDQLGQMARMAAISLTASRVWACCACTAGARPSCAAWKPPPRVCAWAA